MGKRTLLFIAGVALAPATALADGGAAAAGASAMAPDYSNSMSRLQDAADRLRQSIQAMAQQAPGAGRRSAIEQAQKALYDTQVAMMELPPELRTGAGTAQPPNDTRSFERLKQAAQQLRESVQAMAQQPAGERRNEAARAARAALLETQEAMVMLPPELRSAQAGTH
jgi:hypothetical protein